MSQLPGTIHVKRKLEEEPLETLYIEREGSGPNLDEHSARQIYRLVKAIKRPRLSHDSLAGAFSDHPPTRPMVKMPAIVTEDTSIDSQPGSVTINAENIQTISSSSSKTKAQQPLQTRRVFHLSVPGQSSLSRTSSASSLRSLVRRRGRHGAGLAVFTEKRIKRVDQMARVITKNGHEMLSTAEDATETNRRPRKRPSTRTLSHRNSTTTLNSSTLRMEEANGDDDLELAAELRQFALETVPTAPDTVPPAPDTVKPAGIVIQPFPKKPMKYQPKPPRPRQTQNLEHQVAESSAQPSVSYNESSAKEDVSDEWVYDVYVRDVAQPSLQSADIPLQHDGSIPSERIGFIVIRAEDEEALEEFMSDDSDSNGLRDDDEDSNAEDYYANDYPDELDSDDEWKIGHGSDEEYDIENYVMSDDERD